LVRDIIEREMHMFQMLIGLAFLGLIAIPIFILILCLYQNLLENLKPKAKQKPIRAKSYDTDSDEFVPVRLRIVK